MAVPPSSPGVPDSDELTGLCDVVDRQSSPPNEATFSDDLLALHDESQRVLHASGQPIHRIWTTQDIFRSEPQDIASSQAMAAGPVITSSPPPTPSPSKKRKFSELKLGENTLARPPKAQRSYYGINIHQLLDEAKAEEELPKAVVDLPTPPAERVVSKKANLLWTEKYRARKFTDLIGDERTHRAVMHWLKRWDPIMYPGTQRAKKKSSNSFNPNGSEEKAHRKILLLTGPPGLGKTTLAHVCARQAGFEVQEINASDERSGNVVRGRIRDMVGTENVKGAEAKTADGGVRRKAGRPVCVVVDEVDGVVTGSGGGGGGEGGFVKALLDLVTLDAKNSTPLGNMSQAPTRKKKDRFRLLRPLILICNDIYAPALRALRQSNHAEVIHVRKPPVQSLVSRLQGIFEREHVPADVDGVRRLCEATWGISNRKEDKNGAGAGEGDMRGILVVGEWVAGKLRTLRETSGDSSLRLTRRWVEDNILSDLSHGGGAARGLGRGGPKDIVERVFQEGAGFPKSTNTFQTPGYQHDTAGGPKGVAEGAKRSATDRLRELLDTNGETDRILTDIFTAYPSRPFQDDTYLSKPDKAYEWLHFHDTLNSAVFSSNEWELAPYLSTPVLGLHHLFAAPTRAQYSGQAALAEDNADAPPPHPFDGPGAPWAAHEAHKHSTSLLQSLQSSLSLELGRAFNSPSAVATDLLPYLLRMLHPQLNPTIVGGSGKDSGTASVRKASEQLCAARAVNAMAASGVRFEKTKVAHLEDAGVPSAGGFGQRDWVYRMTPSLDELGVFGTGGPAFGDAAAAGKARYAVRQVLEQEFAKAEKRRAEEARMARFGGVPSATAPEATGKRDADVDVAAKKKVERDFFGRVLVEPAPGSVEAIARENRRKKLKGGVGEDEGRVWVTFHEGFSNAVRKPIGLGEFMRDL